MGSVTYKTFNDLINLFVQACYTDLVKARNILKLAAECIWYDETNLSNCQEYAAEAILEKATVALFNLENLRCLNPT